MSALARECKLLLEQVTRREAEQGGFAAVAEMVTASPVSGSQSTKCSFEVTESSQRGISHPTPSVAGGESEECS